jgi:hypothetical protein
MNRDKITDLIPNLHIDEFLGKKEGTFLLTHFHADHIKGLNQTWNKGLIYCSFITKRMMCAAAEDLCLSNIKALKYNTPYNIADMKLIMYKSNHLAGGAMFYIEYNAKKILYTGDFKYSKSLRHLKNIDTLFIDGTFNHITTPLPTLKKSVDLLLSWISSWEKSKMIYIGYTHIGVCELLKHTKLQFKLCSDIPKVTKKAIEVGYSSILDSKSKIVITPFRTRGKNILTKKPMLIISARFALLPENHTFLNEIATNNKGLYRLFFSNHSHYPENLKLIKDLQYPEEIYQIH